nr:copia protein [Tanacetum cinerariifolium]
MAERKKLEKSYDTLALVAHTGSSSRTTSPHYVIHPSLVVDYDDGYQEDAIQNTSEYPLTFAMILLARSITQHFSNPTNNRHRTSSNTRIQAIVQADKVHIQSRNSGNDGKNIRRSHVQKEVIEGTNVQNDAGNTRRTLRTTSLGTTANVQCYNCSEKGHYARNCPKPRVQDLKYFMEHMLLAKQDEEGVILTDEHNDFLFADASRMKEIKELNLIRDLEQQPDKLELCVGELKRETVELQKTQSILKRKMSENVDKYHDTILDLEARAKKNEDTMLNIGNSLQGIFMLGPKLMSFYYSKVKHGLGYTNLYTLKKAISQNPKLYDATCLDDSKIHVNVRDTKDILDDATKSLIKMKKKSQDPIAIKKKQNVQTIDYKKLNALYEDFVPQKEFSVEQKYVSSSFIASANSSNAISPSSSSETKPTVIQIIMWIVDSGCSKHMTALGHNLFSIGQFCNDDLEVSFRSNTCYVRNLKGDDFLTRARESNLYNISISDMVASLPVYLPSKATSTQSRLWHHRLSQLNFGTINDLTKHDLVDGLPKFKYNKDHPCSVIAVDFYMKFYNSLGRAPNRCSSSSIGKARGLLSFTRGIGLGHDLFSIGQFCNDDLEVSFRSNTCYVRNLKGDDFLTRAHESNLYNISISDMVASLPVYLLSKATSTKSRLWHHKLSQLNFGTINDLTKHDLVDGLPKFKYNKDHLCSVSERGKRKKSSHPPKLVPSTHSKFKLLHKNLCGTTRVATINGKKYIPVIVDDYSRYTCVPDWVECHVVVDFYMKFYNSLGRVPNRCSSSSIGKARGLLSFTRGI